MIRNLAVYKEDGSDWTQEECRLIISTCEGIMIDDVIFMGKDRLTRKYVFDDGTDYNNMYPWNYSEEENNNFKNCTKISYEDFVSKYINKEEDSIYPLLKMVNESYIVEFSDESTGEVVWSESTICTLGFRCNDWTRCGDKYSWKDVPVDHEYFNIKQDKEIEVKNKTEEFLQGKEEVPEECDAINPSHYNQGIETIDYMKAYSTPEEFRGHLRLTALKYLSRYGKKDDELQELKKASWYLNKLIEELEG